jgi:hypothetical protein
MASADTGMPSLPDRSARMVLATDSRDSIGLRVWSVLTMFVAIGVGGAVLLITDGPWWVGSLASVATGAFFWAIEWAVGNRRRPAKDPG